MQAVAIADNVVPQKARTLTTQQVQQVLMLDLAGIANGAIAEALSIPPQWVSHIRRGKIYKDVKLTPEMIAEAKAMKAQTEAIEAKKAEEAAAEALEVMVDQEVALDETDQELVEVEPSVEELQAIEAGE